MAISLSFQVICERHLTNDRQEQVAKLLIPGYQSQTPFKKIGHNTLHKECASTGTKY